ncbi:MAG TPA: PQQ-binding-like beta-propeller repeat protein [Tepidisphaeraceae bacterium]|jgi:outer membrane protein assembly factor BamB|nr:PQQ-binding-like beta-propeller repeat protein [Tepidisphaeraceae bacterium]
MKRFLLPILVLATSLVARASDWPQFLGPDRNGTYAGNDLASSFPAGGPKVVWKRDVGQGFAGPVVSAGKLILFHRVEDKETVECLDAKTGAKIWLSDYPTHYQDDFGFDEGPRATPSIADGKVYTFGAEGMLSCWDLGSGTKVWQADTKEQFTAPKGFFGMVCSPLVEGDRVIVNVGGGQGAGIVAFDRKTGAVLWKATDDEAGYSSPIAATFGGKRYILDLNREGLVALDPGTGKVFFNFHWRSRNNASVNAATPLVIGDDIFISASYGTGAALLRFKETGPEKIWSGDNVLSNHYATSMYHNGFLFGYDGRQENGPNLRCVEAQTGKVLWSEDHFGAGTLMGAGDKLLILTEKGELILAPANADSFKPISRAQILPFDSRAYPALADGLYYARSKEKLVCVDLRSK